MTAMGAEPPARSYAECPVPASPGGPACGRVGSGPARLFRVESGGSVDGLGWPIPD